ncbi:MAG: S-layer homology domain-containing protein [Bacillota bacterium]
MSYNLGKATIRKENKKMSKKQISCSLIIILSLLIMLLVVPTVAMASVSFVSQIPDGYEKSCNLCHTSVPTLNQFGKDFKAAGNKYPSKTTTTTTTKPTTTTTTTTKPATTTTTTKPATTTATKPATPPAPAGVTEREFADAVASAYAFNPSNPSATLTREGAAEYMLKILGLNEKAGDLTTADIDKIFADAGIKDSKTIGKANSVALVVKLGLMKGLGNGNFDPKGVLTKSQANILAKRVTDYDSANNLAIIQSKSNLDIVSTISTEWLTAGHAKTVEPLAYAGPRDGCQPCHSGNGLQQYGTDDPYTPGTAIKTNPLASDKAYLEKDPNNAKYTFMFDPHAAELPGPIGCATCHASTGADIMKSGVVPAKLNVYSAGTTEWNVGSANALCFTCHNGRRDTAGIYKAWTTPGATKANTYPHHGWGALVTGKGGMEYPGVKYAQSTAHQSVGCIGCHMPNKEGYVSHEFKPNIATCNQCHVGQTEFTMGGNLKKELEEKLVILEKLVLAKIPGAVKIGVDNSTAPALDKDGKRIAASTVASVEALVGAYNYALILQELEHGGKGVHNPQYAKALLNESIKKLQ